MPNLQFSAAAKLDLIEIGIYSHEAWGEAQSDRYVSALESFCLQLAENPKLGRACDHIRPGLRRHELDRHVIFYRISRNGVFISRVLHHRMIPTPEIL